MVHPYACKGRKQIAFLSVDRRQVYHWPPRRLAWGGPGAATEELAEADSSGHKRGLLSSFLTGSHFNP